MYLCVCVSWFIVLRRHVVLFFLLLLDSLSWPRRQFFLHRRYCLMVSMFYDILWYVVCGILALGLSYQESQVLLYSGRVGCRAAFLKSFEALGQLKPWLIWLFSHFDKQESKCCMLIFAVGWDMALHCNVFWKPSDCGINTEFTLFSFSSQHQSSIQYPVSP